MDDDFNVYIHYHEYDFNQEFPTLVIQGPHGSAGYNVDRGTLDLDRVCICAAYNSNECCCGFDWEKKE